MKDKIEWVSPKEAAKILNVSLVTLYRYMNRENDPIPSYKISNSNIRINRLELDVWVIRQGVKETIAEEGPEHYE